MVLDVSKFAINHPGGRFLIHHNIGRDVSKFFYGGYILENDSMKPHRHSNIARKIVNTLVIGKLDRPVPTF
jgi:cytochrome b involved in lipid metabolism